MRSRRWKLKWCGLCDRVKARKLLDPQKKKSFMCNSVNDRATARSLLIRAVQKQLELRKQVEWEKELPDRCPPILWFGDAESKKRTILTVGANPSRAEYLSKYKKDKPLSYLELPNNRFRLLNSTENFDSILEEEKVQDEIITGYNSYFYRLDNKKKHLSYTRWFGMNKPDSYNVEGFLRGFGASYYDNDDIFQAIHIDLVPFATLSDFTKLPQNIVNRDFFDNRWAANFIQSLVKLLNPSLLIIFGRTNFNYFSQHIDKSISQVPWQGYGCGSYCLGNTAIIVNNIKLPFIGLSTNLGNPRCFTASSLKHYGKHLRNTLLTYLLITALS
jgi:hypothetical protein